MCIDKVQYKDFHVFNAMVAIQVEVLQVFLCHICVLLAFLLFSSWFGPHAFCSIWCILFELLHVTSVLHENCLFSLCRWRFVSMILQYLQSFFDHLFAFSAQDPFPFISSFL